MNNGKYRCLLGEDGDEFKDMARGFLLKGDVRRETSSELQKDGRWSWEKAFSTSLL